MFVEMPCAGIKCTIPGEKCINGACMCGLSPSCAGRITGSYCDVANNICKCSPTVMACKFAERCDVMQKVCRCGSGESCAQKIAGDFCDVENNSCKCTIAEEACKTWQTCDNEKCKGKKFFIHICHK